MIVTKEIILSIALAILGDIDDFKVGKNLKFDTISKSYNRIKFELFYVYGDQYLSIDELDKTSLYWPSYIRRCSCNLRDLTKEDIDKFISFMNKQRELDILKNKKIEEDNLSIFRYLISKPNIEIEVEGM